VVVRFHPSTPSFSNKSQSLKCLPGPARGAEYWVRRSIGGEFIYRRASIGSASRATRPLLAKIDQVDLQRILRVW
jgi:hypothetical protein